MDLTTNETSSPSSASPLPATCRPVPAPRRLYPELRKSEYENVAVELINKNLNINSENLQNNNVNCNYASNNEKVPNNKVFLLYPSLPDDLEKGQQQFKSILTETNDLYGPNANENVPELNNAAQNSPRPAPRPRKPQNTDIQNYENAIIKPKSNLETVARSASPHSQSVITRRAPDLPPKTYLNSELERLRANNTNRYSISSEISTTSSSYNHPPANSAFDKNFQRDKLSNSVRSHKSSSSSLTDSIDSSESPSKFKSQSPGDLLKSLGNTSKLLSESIGERMASRAKGAKNKLDKNLKSSTEILSNIGSGTSNRIRKISSNFTLAKKDKSKENMPTAEFFDAERPQTLPPNDQVFNTISFSSPLSLNKTKGMYDLRSQQLDNSYEVPKSIKRVERSEENLSVVSQSSRKLDQYEQESLGATEPPCYEDVVDNRAELNNSLRKKPNMFAKNLAEEAASRVLLKQQNRIMQQSAESSDNNSRDSVESPPMPTIPAPVLSNIAADKPTAEPMYGKILPPVRQKRRKNYEDIQLRRAPTATAATASQEEQGPLRVNVDSAELHQLNAAVAAAEREESIILRERLKAEEMNTPQPDRSDSWEYYEEDKHSSTSSASYSDDAEHIYANHEMTYGNVFEMATSNKDILTPRNALINISEEESSDACDQNSDDDIRGAVGGEALFAKDVIKEFDPLLTRNTTTLCRSDKSNQLLLLEYLLEEETYGTVDKKHDDEISMCTSEDDNLCSEPKSPTVLVIPSPSLRKSGRINEKPTIAEKPMQIIHQNAHLLSDSKENILDEIEAQAAPAAAVAIKPATSTATDFESRVKPYLACIEEKPSTSATVDLTRATTNRSQWFINNGQEEKPTAEKQRVNPFNKLGNIDDEESPPSYLEAISGSDNNQNKTTPLTSRFMNNTMNVFSNVKIRVDALKRKASFKVAQKSASSSDVKVTMQMIPKPLLSPLLVRFEGHLIRFPSGVVEDILKEMQNRKAILRDRQFQTFLDSEMKTPKESIPLDFITTIQCVSNSRVTDNSTHFYCFEITTSVPKNGNNSATAASVQHMSNPNLIMTSSNSGNVKHQRVSHLYGVGKESERGVWMQKLLESLTNSLPTKYTCHYYRAGWCYLKSSITSEWSGTWLVLKKSQRRLIFVAEETGNVEKMDLRKARCSVLKDSDDSIKNLHVESGPMLMIDAPPFTVYMIMSSPRETKIWRHIIREVAHNNGFSLSDQQLTKFNVPVIVDKCINFVYIHGSMSEGIYRKSGSENSILKLMSAFRADAFNVEITRNEYNEHDVANVLKRFMRDLPERLMGKLSESFICVSELSTASEKITLYKELLARLNVIERETLKKIVGHLSFISSQKSKNKMSIQNLTMIWGPTLMQNHQGEEMVYSQKEADVLCDLVSLYKNLFPLSADEVKREQDMLMCLQKYYAAAETLTDSVKKSGDLKMWITLNPNPDNTTEEKTQVNVTISPTKTAYEICQELAPKMRLSTHEVTLHEVILNGSLERPLHHDTRVFDVVLNWSYWPEDDRKHNLLAVKPVETLKEVQRAVKNLATFTPGKELKFADYKTKSYKAFQCELRDGKIVISKKDKNDKTTIVREIFLHSSTAYFGCEKKRDFPWSWAITFVEKTQTQILRSRDSPYIGHVLAGSEWVDRTIWYSCIWYSLYGDSILPPAEIIIK